jgi:hypothetical protein
MTRTLLSGATLVLAALAFGGPALAVTPYSLGITGRLAITVGDAENAEVWHDLRPDVPPPPPAVDRKDGERHEGASVEPFSFDSGGGNIENQEVWHDLETSVTPPPGQ